MSILNDQNELIKDMNSSIIHNYIIGTDTRRSGRSSRLVWYYIDKFFKSDRCTKIYVKDHYDDFKSHRRLIKALLVRLEFFLASPITSINTKNYITGLYDNLDRPSYFWIEKKIKLTPDQTENLIQYNNLINYMIQDFFKNNKKSDWASGKKYKLHINKYEENYSKFIIDIAKKSIVEILIHEYSIRPDKIEII